jgi:SulP family sulfate permease
VPGSGIAMLAPLPGALPSLSHPEFSLASMQSLLAISLSIAVLISTEAISVGRSLALKAGQRYDASQELVGQGLANLGASFFSGYPAAASFNRSAANYEAGARTPLAAVFSAAFLAVMVLLLAPLAAYLPYAALAGLLVMVAWGLIDFAAMRRILASSRSEAAVLVLTLAATLLLSLEVAILVGVIGSLVVYLHRTSHPALRSLVPDRRTPERKMIEADGNLPECPQMKLLRIEGSIYFGAVPHVEEHFEKLRRESPDQKHLVIMSKSINFIDLAGADLLLSEVRTRRDLGGDVYFYSLRKPVEKLLEQNGYLDIIGRDHVFRGKREAFATVYTRLDPELCRRCTVRAYQECETYPRGETSTGEPSRQEIPQNAR